MHWRHQKLPLTSNSLSWICEWNLKVHNNCNYIKYSQSDDDQEIMQLSFHAYL